MSDPVQELVNAIAGMRQDLTRVSQQIDKKAATPEQLQTLSAAIGKADPAKLAEAVTTAAAGAAASVQTFVEGQEVISRRLQSVELDALAAAKEAAAVSADFRRNVLLVGAVGASLGLLLGIGGGWVLWRPPESYTEAACQAAGGDMATFTKDGKGLGYRCGFPAVKDPLPSPPPAIPLPSPPPASSRR